MSEGQQETLVRNTKKLELLEFEIEELEESLNDSIRESIDARLDNQKREKKKRKAFENQEDDEGDIEVCTS